MNLLETFDLHLNKEHNPFNNPIGLTANTDNFLFSIA